MCACVKFLISFYAFFVCAVAVACVLILYERCFSYSTSMVFFLFFLVIFFIAFSVSLARVGLCYVVFFSLVLSFRLLAYLFIFFSFLAVEFCMILVGECVCVYPLLLLLLLVVVVMLLYRLFYFVFFFRQRPFM